MGWLHVINAGWGMYLNDIDLKKISLSKLCNKNIAPSPEELEDVRKEEKVYFKDVSNTEFRFVVKDETDGNRLYELDAGERVLAKFMLEESYQSSCRDFVEHHDWKRFVNEAPKDDYFTTNLKIRLLAVNFTQEHHLPHDMFKSTSDYNGNVMLFHVQTYPLPEERLKQVRDFLTEFSQEKYEKMLNTFLSRLCEEDITKKLEWCEEYIKE